MQKESQSDIRKSSVFIGYNSSLILEKGAEIVNADVYVQGIVHLGRYSKLGGLDSRIRITIDDGEIHIGHHSKVTSDWVWARFGGIIHIGNYTNVNQGSQIRSDESVRIGDYCMVSYDVNIWDTNTHAFYLSNKRREITEKYWPYYGKEIEKPETNPVIIGDDVWIGERVSVLKGSHIGSRATIGLGTVVAGKAIPDDSVVVPNVGIRILK